MSSTNISCLPPKPPPTRSQNTRTLSGGKIEQVGQRAPRQERHLRAGADIEDSVGIDPGEAAMGFQRGVLHPLRRERTFIGDRGLRASAAATSPIFAMDFGDDIARSRSRRGASVVLSPWITGAPGAIAASGSMTAGQDFVLNLEPAAAFFGGGFAFGDRRPRPSVR